ncbi:MAG: hypothetical protein ACP5Q4_05055 [Candidatus Caldatribacteriaceae bacterium]
MAENPVETKIELLKTILSLTQKMQELSNRGLSDEVFALLEERGKLIQVVEQCDREIDPRSLSLETQEEMLTILHQIATINEEVSARLFATMAAEREALLQMRQGHTFLQKVQENLLPPDGLDIQG